jgi:Flp pilus assembly protein TadD
MAAALFAVHPINSEAIRLQPDHVGARNNLGVALGRSGDYEGARREWEEVLKIDPRNEPARRNLDQLREMGY